MGKKEVFLTCRHFGIFRSFWGKYNAESEDLVLDFRQNDKSEWTSIGRSKKSMSYIVQNISDEGVIRKVEMQYTNDCEDFKRYCSARIDISVQIKYDECLSDPKMLSFRCRLLSRNETLDKSREERLPLKGEKTK